MAGFLSKSIVFAAISVMAVTPLRAQSASCEQIRAACKNAGFVRVVLSETGSSSIASSVVFARSSQNGFPDPADIKQQLVTACRDSLSKQSADEAQPAPEGGSRLTTREGGRTCTMPGWQ